MNFQKLVPVESGKNYLDIAFRKAREKSKKKLKGEDIDIKYEVPTCLSDPKTSKGEYRVPYIRFVEDKRTEAFENGFVVFTKETFLPKKKEIDEKS